MAIALYGPDAVQAQNMQELYRQITVSQEGNFELEFPVVGSGSAEDMASSYEQVRVQLLTLFRNGLKALNARDGQSILREYYPTPGVATPFFDEVDVTAALNSANQMLNPRDPYFTLMVTDGEIGVIRMLGDIINMVNKYADARSVFTLLRMFVRPVKPQGQDGQPAPAGARERSISEIPFDERKQILIRRRNSIMAVNFRADNNYLIPNLLRKFKDPEEQKILTGVINAYDQNAVRLKLSELQQSRWLFVLLNGVSMWKEETMGAAMVEGLNSLTIAFSGAEKPEDMAVKIDGFIDAIIRPIMPKDGEGAEGAAGQEQAPQA